MSDTIKRAPHSQEAPYFLLARDTAQNRQLSYEALGVLTYLLSKPGDWEIRVSDLLRDGCGRDRVYRILNELVAARYLKPRKRYQGDGGKWQWTPYLLYEEPYPEIPDTEKPDTEQPYTEKPDILQSTESQSTEGQSTEKEGEAPTADDVAYGLGMRRTPAPRYGKRAEAARNHPLVKAYITAFSDGIPRPVRDRDLDTAEQLDALGATPEDVTELVRNKVAAGKPHYPFAWLVTDMPGYLARKRAGLPTRKDPFADFFKRERILS